EPSANSPCTRTMLRTAGVGWARAKPGISVAAAPAARIEVKLRRVIMRYLRNELSSVGVIPDRNDVPAASPARTLVTDATLGSSLEAGVGIEPASTALAAPARPLCHPALLRSDEKGKAH